MKQNNMKQNILRGLMAVTFMSTLLLAGCQKDTVTLRLRINNFGDNGKVTMNNRLPAWTLNDVLWINGEQCTIVNNANSNVVRVSVPSASSYRAIYPYSSYLSDNGNEIILSLPSVQPYDVDATSGKQIVKAPMAGFVASDAGSSTNLPMSFNNLGALLAINIENNLQDNVTIHVIDVVVTSVDHTLPLWGRATVSNISDPEAYYQCDQPEQNDPNRNERFIVKLARTNDNDNDLFSLNNGESKPVYIYVPSHGTENNRYSITVHYRAGNGTTISETSRSQQSPQGGNLERNQMAIVSFPMLDEVAPFGAVPVGKFSVSADQKVWFSAGNLQWQPTNSIASPGTGTWRIATNQWDFVGFAGWGGTITGSNNNKINDGAYTGWIDMFGWGTSGYHVPGDSYNLYYNPYDYTKVTGAINSLNFYGYGPSYTDENTGYDLTDDYEDCDWGVYNSSTIKYDGTPAPSSWRTLTITEWKYLLGVNTPSTDNRTIQGQRGVHYCYAPATIVDGSISVNGVLIYPDGYEGTLLTTSASPHCTLTPAQIPEGCAFLPTTSYRDGSGVNTGTANLLKGYYWSSTNKSTKQASSIYVQYSGSGAAQAQAFDKCMGLAVRLVTPVQ